MTKVNGRSDKMLSVDLKKTAKLWPSISDTLCVPHNKVQYERAVKRLDELIDEVGENEKHPLASLMETISTLIEEYENDNVPELLGEPVNTLKEFMREHELHQADLSEIGSQGVVSEILSGKRELNVRQIEKLSKMFNVSPAVFF